MSEPQEYTVIEGKSGASGLGFSELKDVECEKRFAIVQSYITRGQPVPTSEDEQEAFRCGVYLHAARAKWFVLMQQTDKETIEQCQAAAKQDCIIQGYSMGELTCAEYELKFLNYAKYWAQRIMPKPYAVELFLEHDFSSTLEHGCKHPTAYIRTTRLDDVSYYPDIGGYCIGEFKSTFDLGGALKFYNETNPQILLQQLIYLKSEITHEPQLPKIKGTMVDIWDKGRNKGTRQYLPINQSILTKYEVWLGVTLTRRHSITEGMLPQRNYFACNTFNDAYKSQCKFKERCAADD